MSALQISSPEFEHNETIPQRYTCQGEDINPPLRIQNVPEGTESLALIMDDPDAPIGTFDHWIVFDIDPEIGLIEENTIPGVEGSNTFGRVNYGGPCPPDGEHRYFFKIYALDKKLELEEGVSREEMEREMEEHIIEQAELIGLYEKT